MRGMGCLFFYFVFDGVSLFRQQGWCWYWTPSFRRVSNCISFVSTARNFVTCEHVVKRNVILHSRFFCVQKHLRFTPTYSKGGVGEGGLNTDNAVPTIHKVFVVWIRLLKKKKKKAVNLVNVDAVEIHSAQGRLVSVWVNQGNREFFYVRWT